MDNYHFIGIGGIGMSALAHILRDQGYNVSGSDEKSSFITKKLKDKGIKIFLNIIMLIYQKGARLFIVQELEMKIQNCVLVVLKNYRLNIGQSCYRSC